MAVNSSSTSSIGVSGRVAGNIQNIIGHQTIINIRLPRSNRQHLNELPPEFTNLLPPEVRATVRALRPIAAMERSIHSGGVATRRSRRPTAVSEQGPRTSQTSANDPEFSVDGAEGAIFLFNLREKLKTQKLTESEITTMFDALNVGRSLGQRASNVDELFRVLMETGRLREDDVIYLQCLLWVAGRNDVMEVVTTETRRQQQSYDRNISHLRTSVEQRNDYRCVHFHINVHVLEMTAERLKGLETTVATLLGVPLDFVAVAGVNLGSSAWVSVMVPEEAYKTLVNALFKEEVQRCFAFLGVDKIAYDSNISDVTPTTSTADAEEPNQNKRRRHGDAKGMSPGKANGKENVYVLPPLNGASHASFKRRKTTRTSAAKLREEDDEDAVTSILKSQLHHLTRPDDHPAYVFHNVGITKGKRHVIVLHQRIGLIILQVENLTSQLSTIEAAEDLQQARKEIAEMTGKVLDYEDILTVIASPNLENPSPEKRSQSPDSEPTIHIVPGKSERCYREWLQSLMRRTPSAWKAQPDLYLEIAHRIDTWHDKNFKK